MPKVSAEHTQARRGQILDAAAGCFSRSGFGATAVPDIAAAAGLSVGSLYRYFPSKEDLFLAVVASRSAVHNDTVFAELARSGSPVRRIRAALRRLQRLLERQSPDDARLSLELWTRAHDVAGLQEWLGDARRRRFDGFREVIDTGKLSGAIRREVRTSDAAGALMAIADGLLLQRACAPFHAPPGDALAEAERLLASWEAG